MTRGNAEIYHDKCYCERFSFPRCFIWKKERRNQLVHLNISSQPQKLNGKKSVKATYPWSVFIIAGHFGGSLCRLEWSKKKPTLETHPHMLTCTLTHRDFVCKYAHTHISEHTHTISEHPHTHTLTDTSTLVNTHTHTHISEHTHREFVCIHTHTPALENLFGLEK